MKSFIFLLWIGSIISGILNGMSLSEQAMRFPIDPDPASPQASSWYRERMKELQSLSNLPKDGRLLKLGLLLNGYDSVPNAEVAATFRFAQKAIMSVQGYVDFYESYAKETGRMAQNEESTSSRAPIDMIGLYSKLPSPESVMVLGGYLDDTRGTIIEVKNGTRYEFRGFASRATQALNKIGIQNPPTDGRTSNDEDRRHNEQAWLDWFTQVKAGNRKFKFVGSDVEYSLADRSDAPPRSHRDSERRPRPPAASLNAPSAAEKSSPAGWIWALAIAILGGGGFVWMKRRASMPSR